MDGERVDSGARAFVRELFTRRDAAAAAREKEKEREGEKETRISRHAGELPQSVNDFTLVSVTAFSRLCVPGSTQTFTKAPPLLPSAKSAAPHRLCLTSTALAYWKIRFPREGESFSSPSPIVASNSECLQRFLNAPVFVARARYFCIFTA